jgi:hypothetical protein
MASLYLNSRRREMLVRCRPLLLSGERSRLLQRDVSSGPAG